jgi:spore germination cell wall hydrolase CwlJ-like protein
MKKIIKNLKETMRNLLKKGAMKQTFTIFICIILAISSVLIFVIPYKLSKKEKSMSELENTECTEINTTLLSEERVTETTTAIITETTSKKENTTIPKENLTTQKEVTTKKNPIETTVITTTQAKLPNNSVFYLSDYERKVVECIVMGESGGESYHSQVLVAQCILNGCKKEGVQPSVLRTKYRYSGWHNNPTNSVKKAVSDVFDNGYKLTNEPILYFYAPALCTSAWHESQRFVIELDGQRFFAPW